jgi:hypothetical protein
VVILVSVDGKAGKGVGPSSGTISGTSSWTRSPVSSKFCERKAFEVKSDLQVSNLSYTVAKKLYLASLSRA